MAKMLGRLLFALTFLSGVLAQAQDSPQAQVVGEAGAASISDFESNDLSVRFGWPWVVSTDEMMGGNSVANLAVVEGGAEGSAYALDVSGEIKEGFAFPWAGAMFMPAAQPFAPADLQGKPTLHFFARGEGGPYRVQLFCQNLGQIPAEQPFETTDEWQAYSFDLASFNNCDTSGVQAVIFSAGQKGAFSFQIDTVEFR